ncbi:hypothetical protein C8R45DRAFT_434382 [Mycena sanguinolenta]|nr:hypothetical protein C8R45DRAFT_434382 [Mycena sanguinolenta]
MHAAGEPELVGDGVGEGRGCVFLLCFRAFSVFFDSTRRGFYPRLWVVFFGFYLSVLSFLGLADLVGLIRRVQPVCFRFSSYVFSSSAPFVHTSGVRRKEAQPHITAFGTRAFFAKCNFSMEAGMSAKRIRECGGGLFGRWHPRCRGDSGKNAFLSRGTESGAIFSGKCAGRGERERGSDSGCVGRSHPYFGAAIPPSVLSSLLSLSSSSLSFLLTAFLFLTEPAIHLSCPPPFLPPSRTAHALHARLISSPAPFGVRPMCAPCRSHGRMSGCGLGRVRLPVLCATPDNICD